MFKIKTIVLFCATPALILGSAKYDFQPISDANADAAGGVGLIKAKKQSAIAGVISNLLLSEREPAQDESYLTQENTQLGISAANGVLNNEAFGSTLQLPLIKDVDNGFLTLRQDGSFDYLPNTDFVGTDRFVYEVRAIDGITFQAQANIRVNGLPDAKDDAFVVAKDTSLSGNVISNSVGGSDKVVDNAKVDVVSNALTSRSGRIDIDADGSFRYTPPTGVVGGAADTFVYTLRDNDDETSSATLSFNIGETTITTPGTVSLTENAQLDSQTILLTVLNEVESLQINDGLLLTLDDLLAATTQAISIAGVHGEFQITSFNASTGEISYRYTPAGGSLDHSGNNTLTELLELTLKDTGGDTFSAQVTININDVVPIGNADQIGINEGGISNTVTGNVLSNDVLLDGATAVGGVTVGATSTQLTANTGLPLLGSYGSLTLSSTGDFSYTLDSRADALIDSNQASDVFSYTVRDRDGDFATSSLTIVITGSTDGTPVLTISNDNSVGLNNDDITITEIQATGTQTFKVDTSLPITQLSINGTPISPQLLADSNLAPITIIGTHGSLQIIGYDSATGFVSYNYDLNSLSLDHTGAVNDSLTDSFDILVGNAEGSGSARLDIGVIDTAPTAVDDGQAPDLIEVFEDGVTTVLSNVITGNGSGGSDTLGSDDTFVTSIEATSTSTAGTVGSRLDGLYGVLNITKEGSYGYFLNNDDAAIQALNDGDTLTDVFTYTITDADGDTSTATLTLTINGKNEIPEVIISNDDAGPAGTDISSPEAGSVNSSVTLQTTVGLASTGTAFSIADVNEVSRNLSLAELNDLAATNVSFNGLEGVIRFTDYDSASGLLDYTYTPNGGARDHSAGDESFIETFTLVAEASNGLSSPVATLEILIADTFPSALPDTDTINEDDAPNSISGNVRTSNDLIGADSTDLVGAAVGSMSSELNTGIGATLSANFGEFTLGSDGVYTYTLLAAAQTLTAGQTEIETFSYTLKDADGDFSTTSVQISVTGANDAPTLTIANDTNNVGANNDDILIAENANSGPQSFVSLDIDDGLASVSFNSTPVTVASLLGASGAPINIAGTVGTLTINAYDASTGVLDYSYDPTGSSVDHTGVTNDIASDDFVVTARDIAGATNIATINIGISDSAPTAVADTRSVGEDDTGITGNLITGIEASADTQSSDSNTITGVQASNAGSSEITTGAATAIAGTYGDLTVQSGGVYTYVLSAAAQALNQNETVNDVFSYTLKDSDGDFSTTTVTFTIDGAADAPSLTVPNDNTLGANNDDLLVAENSDATGSFTISAVDGLTSLQIGSSTFNPAQLNAITLASPLAIIGETFGDLSITNYNSTTGVVSYFYDPSSTAQDHSSATNDILGEALAIVVTDDASETATGTLNIGITDTSPSAVADDAFSINEDAYGNLTGNVLSNDTSAADTTTVTGVTTGSQSGDLSGNVGTALTATYGELTVSSTGALTYSLLPIAQTLNDGETITETFSYTIKDTDGDFSTTTIEIDVIGAADAPTLVIPNDDSIGTNSDDLLVAEDTNTTGDFTISAVDGLTSLQIGGSTFSPAQLNAITLLSPLDISGEAFGALSITSYNSASGLVSYFYEPTSTAQNHSSATNDILGEALAITVTDDASETATGTLNIGITDTSPSAIADTRTVDEDDSGISGNVITGVNANADTLGADSAEVTGVQSGSTTAEITTGVATGIDGTYGTLTVQTSGSYGYTTNAAAQALLDGASVSDVFSYTIKDSDGDFSTTTFTFTITGSADAPSINIPSNDSVSPNNDDAVVPENFSLNGSFTISAVDGLTSLQIGSATFTPTQLGTASVASRLEITGEVLGELQIAGYNASTGAINYFYDPTNTSQDHTSATNDTLGEALTIIVTDNAAETATDTLNIGISDTAPSALTDTLMISEDAASDLADNVLSNDTVGADTTAVTGVATGSSSAELTGNVSTAVAGTYGQLTVTGAGVLTYSLLPIAQSLNAGETVTDTFSYTIKDSDNDFSTTTIEIDVLGATDAPTVTIPNDDLLGPNNDDLLIAENNSANINGTFTISAVDGFSSLQVGSSTFNLSQLNNASTTALTVSGPSLGSLEINAYDSASGQVSYQYSLTDLTQDHSSATNDLLAEDVNITLTDDDSNSANASLNIGITDTAPTAAADVIDVTPADTGLMGNLITGVNASADTIGTDATTVTGFQIGNAGATEIVAGADTSVTGAYGILTVFSSGEYLFAVNSGAVLAVPASTVESEFFSYTIKDADGDFSTTTIEIRVTAPAT